MRMSRADEGSVLTPPRAPVICDFGKACFCLCGCLNYKSIVLFRTHQVCTVLSECCACFYRAGCLDSRGTGFTALDSHGVQFIQPHANSAVSVPVCPDPGQPLISPKVPETLIGEYRLTEAQPVFSIPLRSGSIPDRQGSPLDPRSQTRCCMYRKPYQ